MTGKQLKNAILQLAIQGKLVPQDPTDEPASALLAQIRKEKEQLVKAGKLKKKDLETTPITDEEKPFEIPESWEWVRLINVVENIADIDHKMPPTVESNGYPYISPLNFTNTGIDFINAKQIDKKDFLQLSNKCKPKRNDIIFPRYGTIGRIRLVETDLDFVVSYSCCTIITLKEFVDYKYLFYILKSNYIQQDEIEKYINKTTQPNVGLQSIKKFIIPLPPLAEQHRIVVKIEELMPLVEAYGAAQEKLNRLNEALPEALKKSILQQAIQGKLVPQDANDEPASALLAKIRKEKEQLVKAGKLKPACRLAGKKDLETTPITDEEKPFDIPESWEWVRLGNLALVARGGSPRPIKDYLTESNDGVNWIKIGDTEIGGKYINKCAEKIKPSGVKNSRLVYPGDFLLTNSMSFGRPYITNVEGCIHDGWLVISQYLKVFDSNFLFFLLSSPFAFSQFADKTAGAVVQNLNKDKVAESTFPLPPLAEQHRIVSKIEELMAMVDGMK